MKILIIPDVHSRHFWKEPVEKYINDVDKVIFLGDYCDPYPEEGDIARWDNTINNFNEIIDLKRNNKDKVVLLLGNHCMHYRNKIFKENAMSTRFDKKHYHNLIFTYNGDNKHLFQICHTETVNGKRVIFTHAGITKYWGEMAKIPNDEHLESYLNHLEETEEGSYLLSSIGKERTWSFVAEETGGPLWCDIIEFENNGSFDENSFQVFGHSSLNIDKTDRIITDTYACLDSQRAFIMLDDMTIKSIEEYEKEQNTKINGATQDSEVDSKG